MVPLRTVLGFIIIALSLPSAVGSSCHVSQSQFPQLSGGPSTTPGDGIAAAVHLSSGNWLLAYGPVLARYDPDDDSVNPVAGRKTGPPYPDGTGPDAVLGYVQWATRDNTATNAGALATNGLQLRHVELPQGVVTTVVEDMTGGAAFAAGNSEHVYVLHDGCVVEFDRGGDEVWRTDGMIVAGRCEWDAAEGGTAAPGTAGSVTFTEPKGVVLTDDDDLVVASGSQVLLFQRASTTSDFALTGVAEVGATITYIALSGETILLSTAGSCALQWVSLTAAGPDVVPIPTDTSGVSSSLCGETPVALTISAAGYTLSFANLSRVDGNAECTASPPAPTTSQPTTQPSTEVPATGSTTVEPTSTPSPPTTTILPPPTPTPPLESTTVAPTTTTPSTSPATTSPPPSTAPPATPQPATSTTAPASTTATTSAGTWTTTQAVATTAEGSGSTHAGTTQPPSTTAHAAATTTHAADETTQSPAPTSQAPDVTTAHASDAPTSQAAEATTQLPDTTSQVATTTFPSTVTPTGAATPAPESGRGGSPSNATGDGSASSSATTNRTGLTVGLAVAAVVIVACLAIGVVAFRAHKKRAARKNVVADEDVFDALEMRPQARRGSYPTANSTGTVDTQVASVRFDAALVDPESAPKPRDVSRPGTETDGAYPPPTPLVPVGTRREARTNRYIAAQQYQKGKLIGRGANGSVYAVLLKDGATIAMKEVNLMGSDEEIQAQLSDVEREMALLSRLEHENLVRHYAIEVDRRECTVRIFMENITGGSLGVLARSMTTRIPEATAASFTRQMLEALVYIHGQNIVHRDLKCDNVLRDAHTGTVKLADFGTARLLDITVGRSRAAHTMIGTPYFMAPEILAAGMSVSTDSGDTGYGTKADIWSLGITVAELQNQGIPPWPAFPSPGHAFLHIANPESEPVMPEGLSEHAQDFIRACTRRDPQARPTARELLEHPWILLTTTSLDEEDAIALNMSKRSDGDSPRGAHTPRGLESDAGGASEAEPDVQFSAHVQSPVALSQVQIEGTFPVSEANGERSDIAV